MEADGTESSFISSSDAETSSSIEPAVPQAAGGERWIDSPTAADVTAVGGGRGCCTCGDSGSSSAMHHGSGAEAAAGDEASDDGRGATSSSCIERCLRQALAMSGASRLHSAHRARASAE